jgi:hypothetical protein
MNKISNSADIATTTIMHDHITIGHSISYRLSRIKNLMIEIKDIFEQLEKLSLKDNEKDE